MLTLRHWQLSRSGVGPDDKVTDMDGFYDALVKALRAAHLEGEEDANAEALEESRRT